MKTAAEIMVILGNYREELSKKFKVKEIGIFGSYVRQAQADRSDVDILVEFTAPVSLLDLVKLENFLTFLLGLKVDLVPKEDIRPELKERILREAIYV